MNEHHHLDHTISQTNFGQFCARRSSARYLPHIKQLLHPRRIPGKDACFTFDHVPWYSVEAFITYTCLLSLYNQSLITFN